MKYIKQGKEKQLAILVDPDKCDDRSLKMLAINAEKNKIDYILVGGSLVFSSIDHTIRVIKSNCHIPVLIFPGNVMQISEHAEGILFLSLIT
jgi:putative glycerol-1-phosphate prenyltransferase